ncbi:MAG TPA: hypothetical protein VMV12_05685 [Candidatus Micrarchaeaceae archaeon]|nr:hypothetical protein [Candidatus Micrarchaeaceae archaeon]
MASRSADPKVARAKFAEFVRSVLAVPKAELDARLADKKRKRAEHPPPNS